MSVLPPFIGAQSFLVQRTHRQWLRELAMATRMKPTCDIPTALQTSMESLNTTLAMKGHTYSRQECYFYPGSGNTCLYALECSNVPSGVSDVLLPVMYKRNDGSWTHFCTINSFQLEALVRAAYALHSYPSSLDQLLLPVYEQHNNMRSGLLKAKLADIAIKTVLKKETGAKTDILISTLGHTIFDESFLSDHCLTCSS